MHLCSFFFSAPRYWSVACRSSAVRSARLWYEFTLWWSSRNDASSDALPVVNARTLSLQSAIPAELGRCQSNRHGCHRWVRVEKQVETNATEHDELFFKLIPFAPCVSFTYFIIPPKKLVRSGHFLSFPFHYVVLFFIYFLRTNKRKGVHYLCIYIYTYRKIQISFVK